MRLFLCRAQAQYPFFKCSFFTVLLYALLHSYLHGYFRWKNFKANYLPLLIGSWCIGTMAAPGMCQVLDAAIFFSATGYILCAFMWCNDETLLLVFFFTESGSENILHRGCSSIKRAQQVTKDNLRRITWEDARQKEKNILPSAVHWNDFQIACFLAAKLYYAGVQCIFCNLEALSVILMSVSRARPWYTLR